MNEESHSAGTTDPLPAAPHGTGGELRRGRPSGLSLSKVDAVCAVIRLTGVPDTTAGAMAGIARSTLSRWKDESEDVEMALTRARAQYLVPRLEKIAQTRLKDGQLDWRAQAWLIKYASPEVHGAPSRRRRLQDVEFSPEEERQAAAAVEAKESVTNRPEIPEPGVAPPAEAREDVAIRPETLAGDGTPPYRTPSRPEAASVPPLEAREKVTNRPETPETTPTATPPPGPREWRPGVPRPTRRELRRQRRMERKAARAQ